MRNNIYKNKLNFKLCLKIQIQTQSHNACKPMLCNRLLLINLKVIIMKRELKFRVFDTYLKQIIYCENNTMFDTNWLDSEYCMQFTGLNDKNGVEIYEGDICKIQFDVDKVEDYIYQSLSDNEIKTGTKIFVVESPLFNGQPELNADIIEIIGNIYENAELL